MKLIDLLTTGKQIKTIPKAEIPPLLGEIETLKAKIWRRLWADNFRRAGLLPFGLLILALSPFIAKRVRR